MSKLIIIASIIILIYIFALSPQNRTKVNTATTDAAQKIGQFAVEKIRSPSNTTMPEKNGSQNEQTPATATANLIDYGRPKCASNSDCTQFGNNINCNATTGNCVG